MSQFDRGLTSAHSEACAGSPRPCLQCKLRSWRDGSGSLGISVPAGWGEAPSKWEQERAHVRELRDAGIKFERASK